MEIIDKVKKTIGRNTLLNQGDHIIVGVSGGPDSMALLHILDKLRYEFALKLSVVHVNHQLRKGADADERFVQKACRSLQIPCTTIQLNLDGPKTKGSLEEIAREKRLESLFQIAKRKKADSIALAQHRDDLAETVLMRILRGTGLLGLQGILPKREISGHTVIRPFIDVTRKEIESFLKKSHVKFRTDPTNKQTRFFRNKVRLQLLPLLKKEYQANITEVLAHLSNTVNMDYDFMESQSQAALSRLTKKPLKKNELKLSLPALLKLHPGLQRMVLRLALRQLQGNLRRLTLTHLKEIEDLMRNRPVGSIVHLPSKTEARKVKLALVLSRRKT